MRLSNISRRCVVKPISPWVGQVVSTWFDPPDVTGITGYNLYYQKGSSDPYIDPWIFVTTVSYNGTPFYNYSYTYLFLESTVEHRFLSRAVTADGETPIGNFLTVTP